MVKSDVFDRNHSILFNFLKGLVNHRQDERKIVHHLTVPKPDHRIPLSFEKGCAPLIVFLMICVLDAIHLDHKSS